MKAEIYKYESEWRWALCDTTEEEEAQGLAAGLPFQGWAYTKWSAKLLAKRRARQIRRYKSEKFTIDV